jgi:hypothetical protein
MFRATAVQEIKIHILCQYLLFENCALYEIMWKNIVEWSRPQMTISNNIALPMSQWLQERASMLRSVYGACLAEQ